MAEAALIFALLAVVASMVAAALLSTVALRPIEADQRATGEF